MITAITTDNFGSSVYMDRTGNAIDNGVLRRMDLWGRLGHIGYTGHIKPKGILESMGIMGKAKQMNPMNQMNNMWASGALSFFGNVLNQGNHVFQNPFGNFLTHGTGNPSNAATWGQFGVTAPSSTPPTTLSIHSGAQPISAPSPTKFHNTPGDNSSKPSDSE